MIIRRMSHSSKRLTKGKDYVVTDGRIVCDDGSTMVPAIEHEPSWKILSGQAEANALYAIAHPYKMVFSEEEIKAALQPRAEHLINNNTSAEDIKSDAQEKSTTKMLKITTPTLINGRDASSFTIDQLIDMVTTEESHIEKLSVVKHKSKAIAKLAARHQANIDAIIVILDSRED